MKSINIFLRAVMLVCIAAGALATPAQPAFASTPKNETAKKGVSPEAHLNANGALKTDGNFNGTFDLEGWDVQLDPTLGPVFTPLAATNQWDNVGTGGGAFKDGVNDVMVNGSDVYVGGWFTDAGGNPEADYIAKWDGAQWTSLSSNGSGDGALTSAVTDMLFVGTDLYVIGYSFAAIDTSNVAIPNAVSLAVWNGTVWSAAPGLSAPLNGWGFALAYDAGNNYLYIGGEFTNISGIAEADRVARLDLNTNTWSALGSNGASDGSLDNKVYSLATDSNGNVYAGGFFLNVNNGGVTIPEADRVAKWDGTNWSKLGDNGSGDGAISNGLVTAIAVDASDNVYVGGGFTNVAGIATADNIAKWNGSAWSGLGNNGSGDGAIGTGNNGAAIQDIVIDGSNVYVAGYFTIPSIPTADYLAKFDTNTNIWSNLGSNGAGNGSLNGGGVGLALSAGNVYVGGYMFDINDNGTVISTADYFGVWDGTNWGTLGDSNGVFNFDINAMAVMGTDVYVGGNFRDLGGDPAIDYLAKWDGNTWSAVGNAGKTYGALSTTVYALAVNGSDLYVGGLFTNVYDNVTQDPISAADYIVRWDGANWYALCSGTGGNGSLNGLVQVIAIDGNNIYAGGNFTNANNSGTPVDAADYLAMFDGANWNAIGTGSGGNGSLGGTVRAIALNGSDVYVGGSFINVNNNGIVINEADYAAKWDGNDWGTLGTGTPIDSHVYALKLVGNDLYVGGQFTNAGGVVNANRIAKYTVNTGAWSTVGTPAALSGSVYSIAELGGNLLVGGAFTDADGLAEADYIAKFNGTSWSALGSDGSGNGSLDKYVYALAISNNDLFVGGAFTNVNNNGTIVKEADFLAAFGINVAPTDIALSASSVNENLPAGTTVGSFSSTDANAGDTFTYSLCGGVDDASFSITGNALKTAAVFDFETKSSYSICVQTSDGNGGTFQEPFTITVNDTNETVNFKSTGAQDGWVLESTEASGMGNAKNNTATTFRLGDDAAKKQYRGILSFNTASLPDNAVIVKITLKLKQQGIVGGGNPVNAFQGILVDIKKGMFGTSALQPADFQTAAQKTYGPSKPVLTNGWYNINLTNGKAYINKLATNGGLTQIRLRFKLDDNNNAIANYLSLFSGNAPLASRPQLIIEYNLP